MVNFLRKTWLTLSLILLCTGVHAAIYNGTSGGTNWTVDTDTGVLTISKGEKYEGSWLFDVLITTQVLPMIMTQNGRGMDMMLVVKKTTEMIGINIHLE